MMIMIMTLWTSMTESLHRVFETTFPQAKHE
jgi:hypothetical protein